MRIIDPYVEVVSTDFERILKKIEWAGRKCYKTENKINEGTAEVFIKDKINRGHLSIIEHDVITVNFVVDRGVSHEIVRHRIASYSQESTRYCNYSGEKFGEEITFIEPFFFNNDKLNIELMLSNFNKGLWEEFDLVLLEDNEYATWYRACQLAEKVYMHLIKLGTRPEMARSVLPNSLKTEVVTTFNIREWRHFFTLRTAKTAHPQMRQVAIPLLLYFNEKMPVFFEDINYDKDFNEENYAKIILIDEF